MRDKKEILCTSKSHNRTRILATIDLYLQNKTASEYLQKFREKICFPITVVEDIYTLMSETWNSNRQKIHEKSEQFN